MSYVHFVELQVSFSSNMQFTIAYVYQGFLGKAADGGQTPVEEGGSTVFLKLLP